MMGQIISLFGNAVCVFTVTVCVLEVTGSAARCLVILAVSIVPGAAVTVRQCFGGPSLKTDHDVLDFVTAGLIVFL